MTSRVNYVLAGAFVLGLSTLLVAVIIWLAGDRGRGGFLPYRVEVEDSVYGLVARANVTYLGVDVGFVEQVELSDDLGRVMLTLHVDPRYRLREGTQAMLRTQLLTGQSTIELSPGSGEVLEHQSGPPPTLEYQRSLVMQIEDSLGDTLETIESVAGRMNNVMGYLEELLSEDNRQSISQLLSVGAETVSRIERMLDDDSIENFQATMTNLEGMTAQLRVFSDEAIEDLDGLGEQTRAVLTELRDTFDQLGSSARQTMVNTGEQVQDTLRRFDRLVEQLTNLTRDLEQDPSQLLRGPQRREPGPGER